MKKTKLSLDKLNVVKLNATHTIVGGTQQYRDTAGEGANKPTYVPPKPEKLVAITLKGRITRNSRNCS